MVVDFHVPTVKDVLNCMDQVELEAINYLIDSAYHPELREDTKTIFLYASVLHNMSYTKQKVAFYLIGKACDITGVN